MSPTSRTLALLRREGYLPAVVEKWIPRLNIRSNLWKSGDVLAVHPRDRVFLIVQTTTITELAVWLKAGGAFEVHSWVLRNGRWHGRWLTVQPGDLETIGCRHKAELAHNFERCLNNRSSQSISR